MPPFQVVEHQLKCQHVRERLGAVEPGFENKLRLAVKQYIPTSNTDPHLGDITLIGAQANAFPKELYEPLWEELEKRLEARGKRIRSIWIADLVHQGQSGVLNEKIIGNDPSLWDHGRDLLFLINQFQDQMPAPLIGIGHSMGGMQLIHMSLFHPRLLHGLILIDPVIQITNPSMLYATASTYRRDIWPSRLEAAKKFRPSKFYQRWDTRVLDRWITYGLRDLPTEIYPKTGDGEGSGVTLTTPKALEVFTFLRPLYEDATRPPDYIDFTGTKPPKEAEGLPFHLPGPAKIFQRLPEVKPSVLYTFGKHSELSTPQAQKAKIEATGIGIGGNGGVAAGSVQHIVLDAGHLVPMERVEATADACVSFIEAEVSKWQDQVDEYKRRWAETSRHDKFVLNEKWRQALDGPPTRAKNENSVQSKI